MRICCWDNQGNSGYKLCCFLRSLKIEAELFLMKNSTIRSFPENLEKKKENNYPNWIHIYENNSSYKKAFLPKELVEKIEKNYDILIVCGYLGMLSAHNFDMPMICVSVGPACLGVFDIKQSKKLLPLGKIIKRYLCKKSIKKCNRVTVHFDPEILELSKYGQTSKQVIWGIPDDVKKNRDLVDLDLLKKLNSKYLKYDKVFLWFSRINTEDKSNFNYKGTEKFLNAVEKIIKEENSNIKVVVGQHGNDWKLFVKRVKEKGLENYFEYVPHIPVWKLLTYLSIKNALVFDELSIHTAISSGMMREALSVNAILIKTFNESFTSIAYGPCCPVLNATTSDEVYERILEVLRWDEKKLNGVKKEIEVWTSKYFDIEFQTNNLINILNEVHYTHTLTNQVKHKEKC